jgi:hypothetical protein
MKELKDHFKNWKSAQLTPQPTFISQFHTQILSLTWRVREREREENLTQSMLQLDMGPIH